MVQVLHAQPLYYQQLWGDCGLPLDVFRQLVSMPEPTSSKWEVMQQCARLFLIVLDTAPGKEGTQMGMMEEFAKFTLDRMRGSADADRQQDAGGHPHRLKWRAISAVLASPERLAGLYFILDMWEFHGVRAMLHANGLGVDMWFSVFFTHVLWIETFSALACDSAP